MKAISSKALLCVAMFGAVMVAPAHAARSEATIVDSRIHYQVQTDGRHVVEDIGVLRIESPQAVQRFAQVPIPFSSTLQTLDVLAAYVVGKDGKRVDVPADRILVQQTPQSAGAPTFDDGKVKVVVFPAVEVGSVLHLHTRRTQLKPLFPGHFSAVETSLGMFDIERAEITVQAPAGLKLNTDAVGMAGGPVAASAPGEQRWRWTLNNWKALPFEAGSVAVQDASPRVAMTTLADDRAAAAAYAARAVPAAAVTPAIQKLADEITAGLSDSKAQAHALYHWVSANIRYVAIFLDLGGVVPHSADEVAKVRYGDCKDHTTLLAALLSAKGIKSSPVLVNADLRYWRPGVPAIPGVYNHAILYLPAFDTYLDSTAALAPFGTLPVTLLGKPALVIDDGSGKSRMATLPLASAARDRVTVQMNQALAADGSITGTAQVRSQGILGLLTRGVMASLPAGVEPQVVGQVLAMSGQNGSGNFTRGEVRDLGQDHVYTTEFKLPAYAQLPGPGAMTVPTGFGSVTGIAATFELLGPEQRQLPMPLIGKRVEETVTLQLPAGLKPTSLPKGTQLTWAHGRYESKVFLSGTSLTISRVLELDLPGPLLPPQDYPAFRSFGQQVMRDLRAQLVY